MSTLINETPCERMSRYKRLKDQAEQAPGSLNRAESEELAHALANHKLWVPIADQLGRRYSRLSLADLQEYAPEQTDVFAQLADFELDLENRVRRGRGIVCVGPCGTGKDHAIAALMRSACLAFGKKVEWRNGMDLYGAARDLMDGSGSEADFIKELVRPDILALSDPQPPVGALTQFQATLLYRIVDARYRNARATWVSLNAKDGADAENRIGKQVVDRLRHGSLILHFNWESYRIGHSA